MRIWGKPKYWVVFDRHGGWVVDVYDVEVPDYRKSFRSQGFEFVEGFENHNEAWSALIEAFSELKKSIKIGANREAAAVRDVDC